MSDMLDTNSAELLQRAMASTPNRQKLLDTWIAIVGDETPFYDFYNTFIFSDIFHQYTLLGGSPTNQVDRKTFDGIYLQRLSVGLIATHKVIQRNAIDVDNIKPILTLFAIVKSNSAKGLSKWINSSYASSFTQVAEMLYADVPAERILFGITNDIDAEMLRAL